MKKILEVRGMKIGDLVDTLTEAEEMIRVISVRLNRGGDMIVGDLISLSDVKSTMETLVEFINEFSIN